MADRLHSRIAEIFTEPACDKNQAKDAAQRKKGCSKPLTPGAAAGGCAFDGAKIALQPITDVVHLVHGPLACEGNGWDNRHAASSGADLYRHGFTTDLGELDIIMGRGETRLYRAIKEAIAAHKPPAVFVYTTCVPALIGDDVEAVCRHATQKLGTPCIPVNAPGFSGSKNLGNKLAGEALLDHVIGTREPELTTNCDINILGEYNLSGELWQIKPLLDQLGIRLHTCISGDARYNDIASCHRARVNMMVCSTALINVARKMEERWGIPYFEGSFYGISDTSDALRTLARLLAQRGAPADLPPRAEVLIAAGEARAWQRIAPYRESLAGKRVLLYTGGVKSWSIVSALQEIGMVITSTSVRKSTDGDKDRIKALMGGDAHMVDAIPPRDMYAQLARGDVDIMLSGGRTQFVALKARMPWLDINQERHEAYAAYDGMVTLVHELHRALTNKVWQEVRRPAPWDCTVEKENAGWGMPPLPGDFSTPIIPFTKALSENPLKASAPLGAALAYLGIEGSVPLFHGAQGCTSFALVLTVRHAREAIPLQTTALDEVAAILGGADNLEQALLNLTRRMKPRFIGIASTALSATRGEDIAGDLKLIRQRQPDLADVAIAFAATPDYDGALEDGWSRAVTAIIDELAGTTPGPAADRPHLNVLAGVHQTAADIEAIVACIESFGLAATVLPDLSTSLDGTVPERYIPHTLGGTRLAEIRAMGQAVHTVAIGEHMRIPAQRLHEKTGVGFSVFPSLLGLAAADEFVFLLSRLTGRAACAQVQRQRSRLVDAMLDAHFHYGGKRVAIAADPDLLVGLCTFFTAMGAQIVAAVASTPHSPLLAGIAADRVLIGDLADFEREAASVAADLLVTHSHGRQAASRLGVPLLRVGFPVFDRLGTAHRCAVLYAGTQSLVFEVANLLMANLHAPKPNDFVASRAGDPLTKESPYACSSAAAH